jgi:hypothetical protein
MLVPTNFSKSLKHLTIEFDHAYKGGKHGRNSGIQRYKLADRRQAMGTRVRHLVLVQDQSQIDAEEDIGGSSAVL